MPSIEFHSIQMLPSARVDATVRYSFSGHESFPLRFGWLPKAVREVALRPDLFTTDEAASILGVGKNMAASIRHWALTTGMVAATDKRGEVEVTALGQALFGPDGWDPFFEDVATAWLVHWQMVRFAERASTWHLAMTAYPTNAFTRDSLATWLLRQAELVGTRATAASIRRDVDVFVRTYVTAATAKERAAEDTLDSPLVELGLIRRAVEQEGLALWSIERAERPTLPPEVLAYAILDFWDRRLGSGTSTSFESLSYRPGSPGAAFRLADSAFGRLLDSELERYGLRFDDQAGQRQVFRERRPIFQRGSEGLRTILQDYYAHVKR